MSKVVFYHEESPYYPYVWDHLRRVLGPDTDLSDQAPSGERWTYKGTYFSNRLTHDSTGKDMRWRGNHPAWHHTFQHGDYRGNHYVLSVEADSVTTPLISPE